MKASLALTAALVAAATLPSTMICPGTAVADSAEGNGIWPFAIHEETLDNGLRVVAVPMQEGSGLVGFRLAIRTGSRDEYEPGRTGFAHFFEHMMFRGTKKYPEEVYSRIMTQIGADGNAYTSSDVTVYVLNIAAEDLALVMEIESDRFQNLAYAKQAFETEAGAVYGEYRQSRMSPMFAIYEAVRKTAFTRHTYGHTTIGDEADIQKMPTMFDYSRSFFNRYYRPDNAILVVAGDVSAERVFELARQHFSPWKRGYVAPKVKAEPEQTKERRVNVAYEGRSLPMLTVAYRGDAYRPADKTYVASHALAELAFGETSEIYRRLVLKEQIVETLTVSPAESRDPGLWTVSATVKNAADIDKVLAAIDQAAKAFQTELCDPKLLADIQSNMRYSFIMGLDSASSAAGEIAHRAAVLGSVDAIAEFYQTLAALTPEDVRAAATRYLLPQRRTIVILRGKEG